MAPEIRSRKDDSDRASKSVGFVHAALLATLWVAACGDDGATEPEPVRNRAPTPVGVIAAQTVAVGESVAVDLSGRFADPDGDALTYAATSSDTGVASVSVDSGVATVSGVSQGEATVAVTVRDPGGLSATLEFAVTVPNRAPEARDTISQRSVFVGDSLVVNAAAHFADPDGDSLTYVAASSDATVVSVVVDGSVAIVEAVSQGGATVSITATDPGGLSAELEFDVTVPNRAPTATDTIPRQSVFVGESASVEVALRFADPDGDSLVYEAASSDAAIVAVSMDGGVAAVEAVSQGGATVSITATDPGGLSAELGFAVTVPNRAPEARDTISQRSVFVGDSLVVDAAAHFADPDGDSLTYVAASSDATVVSVVVDGSVAIVEAVSQGGATVSITATDPGGLSAELGFAVTVPNRVPTAADTILQQSVFVGDSTSVDLTSRFADPDGDSLAFAVASSDARIAAASLDGGVVTVAGVSQGETAVTITATDPGGLSATLEIAVIVPNRAPTATAAIPAQSMRVGESVAVEVGSRFADPDGDSLVYEAGSSDVGVAAVSVEGSEVTVSGVAAGRATVEVAASDPGGMSARLSFQVEAVQTGVAILGVDPVVLIEGRTARIEGSEFSPTVADNRVSLGGRRAQVTAATPTSITFDVPRADCLPPRREELRVTVDGETAARSVGVTPRTAEDLELDVGWYRHTYGGNGCVHLPGDASGQRYVIGVTSISENASSLTRVELTGTPGDASVVEALPGPIVAAVADVGGRMRESYDEGVAEALSAGPFLSEADPLRRAPRARASGIPSSSGDARSVGWSSAHDETTERSLELIERLGRPTGPPAMADARRQLEVGDRLAIHVQTSCTDAAQVQAVVRWVGASSIWLDDLGNPASTFSDAELAELDVFYAENVAEVRDDYFGGLSDVDGNRRFLVLITKEVNRTENLLGRVWSGDLFPSLLCPTSNEAEIFYGIAPDPQGVFGGERTKSDLLGRYPALIAHEVTHLAQFNALIYGDAARKTLWEMEGGATLAEQLVGYRLFGHGSGQELGWDALLPLSEKYEWYWDWFAELSMFFGWDLGDGRIARAPEECSWVGRPSDGNSGPCLLDGRAVYGVPSMVLRYAMDRWGEGYRGGERALMRRLTHSPRSGFASLADVSPGWRTEGILADFYISLWNDMRGGESSGMTTWDLEDIFGNSPENFRLEPYASSSSRLRLSGRRVRAGSTVYLEWAPTGPVDPTSVKVASGSGGRVPGHISVWAYRVR